MADCWGSKLPQLPGSMVELAGLLVTGILGIFGFANLTEAFTGVMKKIDWLYSTLNRRDTLLG